jgi:hypothetical protein
MLNKQLMAKDKKSFLLYADLIHTIEKLNDEQAGKLFKHVLRYVNDQHPESDQFTEVVFEPIKQTLKRDLEKYEGIRQRNSENAKKRWDATACDRIPNMPALTKNADNDSVNDNDIKTIPSLEVFMAYALEKMPDVLHEAVRMKYESWVVNDWSINRKGKMSKIVNWKMSLANTLTYLPKDESKKEKRYEDMTDGEQIAYNMRKRELEYANKTR